MNRDAGFSWDIHWVCNYRCPYCWWHGRWEEISKCNYYPGKKKLLEMWRRIYEKYGKAHLEISGGEPSMYPDFYEILSGIARWHTVGINTNLSFDAREFVEKVKVKDGLKMGATFHPLFANFDGFLKKLLFLRENKFDVGACYLAWPPQVRDIPYYREKFREKDFRLSILTFWGKYEGRDYPQSYTEEEKMIISPDLGVRSGEKFQLEPVITRGKLCKAGHTYAAIHPDGVALKCGGGGWNGKDAIIGNIFDEDFKLTDGPETCLSGFCPCNEWAFLLAKK